MSELARSVEKEAKTVEEAIELALTELGLDQEDVDVDILESGGRGIGPDGEDMPAKVRVTESVSPVRLVSAYLDTLLEASKDSDEFDVKYHIRTVEEDGQTVVKVDISGSDIAYLIGKHGDKLYAINYLANLIVNRDSDDYVRVNIDVADYRKHREETLVNMANRVASKVIKYKKPIALDPMPASERRIIHSALQGSSKVITESEGEDPNRRVVVKLKPYVKIF